MLTPHHEKKLLQLFIGVACIVPIAAGVSGVVQGAALLGGGSAALDSHIRYLSGILLAIGVAFLMTIPRIEQKGKRVRMLTFLVVVGGLARLLGFFLAGNPGNAMSAALVMELVVTPLLCLWQHRIAKMQIS